MQVHPKLNYDVLFHVMSSLARSRDVLSTMQTCYTLYHLGLPILLHDVRLRRPHHLMLLDTLLQQNPTRYELIKTITFSFSSGFERLAGPLVSFLQKLGKLQDLALLWTPIVHDDGMFMKQIAQQVTSMSSLRGLSFVGDIPPRHISHLFTHIQSHLTELDIGSFYYTIHPLTLLAPLKSHLEKLTIRANPGGVSFIDLDEQGSSQSNFPKVRSLSFDCTCVDFSKLGLLPRIFPNVREFTVRGVRLPADQAALTDIRTTNRDIQSEARWETLDRLEGTVRSVYAAGLTSHVKHLRLNLSSQVSKSVPECARAVIGDAKPQSLQVDIQASTIQALRCLPDVLESVNEHLGRLSIGLYLDSEGVLSAVGDDITCELLSSIVQCTALRSLHISFLETKQLFDKDNGFYLPNWMISRFNLIDVDMIMQHVLECMTTLQEVHVEVLDRTASHTRSIRAR